MLKFKLAALIAVVGLGCFLGGLAVGSPPTSATSSADVSNAFWASVVDDGARSSVEPPESDCKETRAETYRCYARWAPTAQREVLVYQAEVNVYPDGRMVVGKLDRQAKPAS